MPFRCQHCGQDLCPEGLNTDHGTTGTPQRNIHAGPVRSRYGILRSVTDEPDLSEVGSAIRRRIREVRKEVRDISQAELGRRIGASQGTVARYERDRTPSIEIMYAIAQALDTTMADLMMYVPGEARDGINREAQDYVRRLQGRRPEDD